MHAIGHLILLRPPTSCILLVVTATSPQLEVPLWPQSLVTAKGTWEPVQEEQRSVGPSCAVPQKTASTEPYTPRGLLPVFCGCLWLHRGNIYQQKKRKGLQLSFVLPFSFSQSTLSGEGIQVGASWVHMDVCARLCQPALYAVMMLGKYFWPLWSLPSLKHIYSKSWYLSVKFPGI